MKQPKAFLKNDRRSRRRLQQLVRRRYIQETEILKAPPIADAGGYLEIKRGKMCLRMADEIWVNEDKTFTVRREWRRPGKYPWSTDLYPVKSPER